MITLIDDTFFENIAQDSELSKFLNRDFLKSELFGSHLRKFALLNYFPEKFTQDEVSIYYNKYYWYLKFMVKYKSINGYDAGIEQQRFKIIEEGENKPGIDWNIIEAISIEVTGHAS